MVITTASVYSHSRNDLSLQCGSVERGNRLESVLVKRHSSSVMKHANLQAMTSALWHITNIYS